MSCSVHGGLCDCEPPYIPTAAEVHAQPALAHARRVGLERLAAAEADPPVIPVGSEARCPTCKGEGTESYFMDMETLSGLAERPCATCQGAGQERVIPATDLRAWIESNWFGNSPEGQLVNANDLLAWLDEYTAKTPSGRIEP